MPKLISYAVLATMGLIIALILVDPMNIGYAEEEARDETCLEMLGNTYCPLDPGFKLAVEYNKRVAECLGDMARDYESDECAFVRN